MKLCFEIDVIVLARFGVVRDRRIEEFGIAS